MYATSTNPELRRLYALRRKAARGTERGSFFARTKAWHDMEAVEAKLREIDPDGDWFYEGRNLETGKWEVVRA